MTLDKLTDRPRNLKVSAYAGIDEDQGFWIGEAYIEIGGFVLFSTSIMDGSERAMATAMARLAQKILDLFPRET